MALRASAGGVAGFRLGLTQRPDEDPGLDLIVPLLLGGVTLTLRGSSRSLEIFSPHQPTEEKWILIRC